MPFIEKEIGRQRAADKALQFILVSKIPQQNGIGRIDYSFIKIFQIISPQTGGNCVMKLLHMV